MGLLSDTYDKEQELHGALEWEHYWRPRQAQSPIASRPRNFPCHVCNAVLSSEDHRISHTIATHPGTSFYVRANERIAPQVLYLEEPLEQLEVVPLGPIDLTVTTHWTNTARPMTFHISANRSLDLVASLGAVIEPGEVRLWTSAAPERVYRIYVHERPEIDHESLDDLVFEAQLPLTNQRASNWRVLRDAAGRLDELERDYLLGFASYLHACNLEREGDFQHARPSLESAFFRLRPFATQLARDTRGILAFRMNAIELLKTRGPASVFWQAANFLSVPMALVADQASRQTAQGIWMDDFQEGLLRAIKLANAEHWGAVDEELLALPVGLAGEPGNQLKRTIISARSAWAQDDRARAEHEYGNLRADPRYGEEAQLRS